MEVKSVLEDHKVRAKSILVEMEVRQYLVLAEHLVNSNPFQRKRVRGSKTVYSLLKRDFLEGCVIPPIVLAYTKNGGDFASDPMQAFHDDKAHFSLLDGLQRTYTLLDLRSEIEDPDVLSTFLKRRIRCEIYQGIDRLGILYRMLTLNTGQTTMSLRHQVEIMYIDFLDTKIEHVQLLREADRASRALSAYSFKDAIDGFNAYIARSESPLDRGEILDNITSLENISKETRDKDLFRDFVLAWDRFIVAIDGLALRLPEEDLEDDQRTEDDGAGNASPRNWGSTGLRAFKRPQALSGFGASVSILRDAGDNLSLSLLDFSTLEVGGDGEEFMLSLNRSISTLNSRAKRIGNAQRLYFRQFFRALVSPNSDSFMNLVKSEADAMTSSLRIGI
ncbi:hypothetical protein [Stenotrophomonas rhizophila]|uniref:hypothetical protein n=1 Tax=Stenotrophomonas rhizophila TaxID=216778 RepID=UPI0011A0318F|nr:hypothetical protein [Stenotrophomonas rhizophila]